MQPQADGFVLRAHESSGCAGTAILKLGQSHSAPIAVNFLGSETAGVELTEIAANTYRISYAAYAIVSVFVRQD